MKVLQINTVYGTGSIGRIEVDINNILQEYGYDCLIAYGRGIPPKDVKAIRIGNDWDILKNGIRTRIMDREGFGSKKATQNFIEKIKKYNPDIIHLHNLHGYYINIEVLFEYLKKSKKRVVWTLHDCWSFTGHCSYFDYIGCNKWKSQCQNCPQKKEYPKSFFIDNSLNNYRDKKKFFTLLDKDQLTIVTPSFWLAGIVKQSFLSKYKVEVIYNGIDLDVFKPTPSNFRKKYHCENKTIVLGVANVWDYRKGLNDFIHLSEKLPEIFQVVLVGISKKQIKKLPDNIIIIEKTTNVMELAKIYTAADIFVNATLEEVLGLTNIEALACGIPVITYNSGGSPECIDKSSGIVIDRNNINKILSKIKSFDFKKEKDFCLKRAKMFNKSVLFKSYLMLYEDLK